MENAHPDNRSSQDSDRGTSDTSANSAHGESGGDVSPAAPPSGGIWTKVIILGVVVAAAVAGYVFFGDALSLESLAEKETALREYQRENPVLVYGIAFLVYVLVTGLSLPGAAPLTLVYGWFFRFWGALVLVSFASTTGATFAFLLSRYLLGDWIQKRFGERLETFNRSLEKEGAFYLFSLRLIPAVPFFVINVVMGLTKLPTRTFWWVSQVGMLAGTAVYVWVGHSVPDLRTLADRGLAGVLSPQLFAAFIALGLLPLILKKVVARLRPGAARETETP